MNVRIAVLAVVFAIFAPLSAAAANQACLDHAISEMADYAKIFRISRLVRITVGERMPAAMEGWYTVAHSTREYSDYQDSCVLHFSDEGIRREQTIAHEFCHCALDHEMTDDRGWIPGMKKERIEFFEARADRCADWLTSPDMQVGTERSRGRNKGGWPDDLMPTKREGEVAAAVATAAMDAALATAPAPAETEAEKFQRMTWNAFVSSFDDAAKHYELRRGSADYGSVRESTRIQLIAYVETLDDGLDAAGIWKAVWKIMGAEMEIRAGRSFGGSVTRPALP